MTKIEDRPVDDTPEVAAALNIWRQTVAEVDELGQRIRR